MNQRPWLGHYPEGVPADVDLDAFASLPAVLQQSCRRFGDRPACSSMGTAMSYAELDAHSLAFASGLQQLFQLGRGDRVALMLPNLLQYPVALFGALRAGLVVVNVNPQYTPSELEHQLLDSGAAAVVVLENFASTVQEVLRRQPRLRLAVVSTQVGDLFPMLKAAMTNAVVKHVKHAVPHWEIAGAVAFNEVLRAGRHAAAPDVVLGHADIAFLQYTGGTTGVAKGAVLTHGNMVANLQQLSAWMAPWLHEGQEIFVCPLPLYHVYALSSCLVFIKLGALIVLVANPRDMPAFIHDLKRHPFTVLIGVSTLYRALLDAPAFADVDTRHLKLANAGGMAVQRTVAERWKAATGVTLVEAYGLTEASPGAIANPLDIEAWTGEIGMPLPSTEAVVLDTAGAPLACGEVGEIALRGPQLMSGYWNRPDETALAFTPDGWLRTGDMGSMDAQGRFRITDRKKDMIVVSGFKVFPNQIEDVVALHPGVAEVAAIGVPDERSGEAVEIVVVRRDPALTEEALLAHCRQHLTGYKMPRKVVFSIMPLPKSAIGKVLRRQVREDSLDAA